MTFATFSNVVLMVLCIVVIVQSVRLTKSFQAIRSSSLNDSVVQLDRATAQAQAVLAELKTILATEGVTQTRVIREGEALRDELSVMVGIGHSVADRIMDAVATQSGPKKAKKVVVEEKAEIKPLPKDAAKRPSARRPRARSSARAKVSSGGSAATSGAQPAVNA